VQNARRIEPRARHAGIIVASAVIATTRVMGAAGHQRIGGRIS
jgi:hypothetical protein